MSNPLKQHRLPLSISVVALALATFIGFIPLMDRADPPPNVTVSVEPPDLSGIEDRLAALEAALAEQAGAAPDIPPNADNARLRQEIDLIPKALGTQTGRVSRLKASVEGALTESGEVAMPQRVADEIALAKRALVNLTRRINGMDDQLEMLGSASPDITRLQQQMALVDRALANVTRRLNGLDDRLSALGTAAADIARLQQQMSNEDRALLALKRASNLARDDRDTLRAAGPRRDLAGTPSAAGPGPEAANLVAIEAKLDAILNRLAQ